MAVRPDSTIESAATRHDDSDTELEQYGVWVKAEPHDIVEEPDTKGVESLGISEFDLPSDAPALPEESFLTEDEEKLIGSFDEIDSSGGTEETPLPLESEAKAESAKADAFPDIEDLPPLEDFEIGGVEEVNFRPDADINIEEIEGLDEAKSAEPSPVESLENLESPSGEMEDVSAEFLDVIEEEGDSSANDATAAFLETPSEPKKVAPAPTPSADFEPLDIDLSFDDSLNPAQKSDTGFEEVSDFDDFLKEEPAVETEKPNKNAGPTEFDDVAALEAELSEPKAQDEPKASKSEGTSALSNELLLKIADELSSIRGELVNLKGQLGALQKDEVTEKEAPAAAPLSDAESAEKRGGFFDEEEDETIALTGDELDNILNTADFTEESAPEPSPEAGEKAEEPLAIDLSVESLLPESGDYEAASEASSSAKDENIAEEPAIEEIRLEPEAEELPPLEAAANDELPDIPILPMTAPPEDTSYLEEPLANEEPLDLGETPLHEEPLVEPDLSSFKIEDETESEAEIAEELPVIEGPSEDESSPETLTDITLGVEAAPDYMSQTNAEAFTIEPIPEMEASSFEDIELPGEANLSEEIEELYSDEETPAPAHETESLDEEISERTVKPSEPVSLHPEEIPMSLDDSFFVESPSEAKESEPAAAEGLEPLAEELEPLVEEIEPLAEEATEAPVAPTTKKPETKAATPAAAKKEEGGNERLKGEIRGVLSYLDKLLESLPEDKIEEFARSEYFDTYKKLFEELGLV